MRCITCRTDSLVFQRSKDRDTGFQFNFWWCHECNKRSQPLAEDVYNNVGKQLYSEYENDESYVNLPKGKAND